MPGRHILQSDAVAMPQPVGSDSAEKNEPVAILEQQAVAKKQEQLGNCPTVRHRNAWVPRGAIELPAAGATPAALVESIPTPALFVIKVRFDGSVTGGPIAGKQSLVRRGQREVPPSGGTLQTDIAERLVRATFRIRIETAGPEHAAAAISDPQSVGVLVIIARHEFCGERFPRPRILRLAHRACQNRGRPEAGDIESLGILGVEPVATAGSKRLTPIGGCIVEPIRWQRVAELQTVGFYVMRGRRRAIIADHGGNPGRRRINPLKPIPIAAEQPVLAYRPEDLPRVVGLDAGPSVERMSQEVIDRPGREIDAT